MSGTDQNSPLTPADLADPTAVQIRLTKKRRRNNSTTEKKLQEEELKNPYGEETPGFAQHTI